MVGTFCWSFGGVTGRPEGRGFEGCIVGMTRPIRRGAKFHIYYTYMYRLCQVKTEASIDPDAHGYASGSADAAATDFLPEVWANSFLAPSRRGAEKRQRLRQKSLRIARVEVQGFCTSSSAPLGLRVSARDKLFVRICHRAGDRPPTRCQPCAPF